MNRQFRQLVDESTIQAVGRCAAESIFKGGTTCLVVFLGTTAGQFVDQYTNPKENYDKAEMEELKAEKEDLKNMSKKEDPENEEDPEKAEEVWDKEAQDAMQLYGGHNYRSEDEDNL